MLSILRKVLIWIHLHALGVWKAFEETIWDRQGSLAGRIPDKLSRDTVIVITGGNRGIGFEAAKKLAGLGCRIFVGVRDPEKARTKFNQVFREDRGTQHEAEANEQITCLKLDLSSTTSVKEFVDQLLSRTSKIHVLINNAGLMFAPRTLTEDGFESQMATNYIGHFLLTILLLKTLRNTANQLEEEKGVGADHVVPAATRIVNVSSVAHHAGLFLDVDDLTLKNFCSDTHAYCASKACQIMFTQYLNQELRRIHCENVVVNAVHPGMVNTDLYSTSGAFTKICLAVCRYLMKTPSQGGDTIVHAAVSQEASESGVYLENCHSSWSSSFVNDRELQKRLWKNTCDALKINIVPESLSDL